MSGKRYIIIGDGAAGTTAAQTLRQADASATIAILSDDPHAAYYRAALTNFLLGELREEQVWAVPPSFYDEFQVHRALVRVAKVETERKLLWLAQGGRPIPYDALVVAAGARARPPSFDGALLPGVMVMRTLSDVHRVFDLIKLKGLRSAVICGGGPLALEWAHGLTHRGIKVMMVVRDRKFMPTAIDNVSSDLLLARLRQGGVEVRMGDEVVQAVPGPQGRVGGVVLKSGERVACELVGVAFGVVCNSEFLQGSPIALAKNGGIVVDERMKTNVPDVYAAGDVAAFQGSLLQLWEPARHQARIAAANILGRQERYAPGVHYMATRLYDLDVASIGDVAVTPQGAEEVVDFPQRTGQISYKKVCIKDNRVVGALLFGERAARVRRHGRALKKLVDKKIDVSSIKADLLDPAFDLGAWINANEITEKPQGAKLSTMASAAAGVAKMKGTHAINLADLPPLPIGGKFERKPANGAAVGAGPTIEDPPKDAPGAATAAAAAALAAADSKLKGTSAFAAFDAQIAPPKVRLEAPFGWIEVTSSSIIGRDPQAPVPLNDPGVSWTHAEIIISGQFVYVRDLGSATGTWVNGAPVTAPKRLKDGEKVKVGSTELLVRIQTSAPHGDTGPSAAKGHAVQASGDVKPHLDVRTGRSLGLSFELVHSPEIIGRDPSCTIRLDDEWIDARHAWLRKGPSSWEVADAESKGVTKRNGQVLQPNVWVPLAPGDLIEVGEVQMSFTMRQSAVLGDLYGPASVHYSASPMNQSGTSQPNPMNQSGMNHPHPASSPHGVRGRLSIRQGPGQGSFAELGDVTVIGAQAGQATLVLPDPYVGPRHLEITRMADGFYARDLGWQTGTACRGQRLGPQPLKLAHGDVLVIGPGVHLVFEATA
ncbi:MAG: FAD-dependent oxidoreductase [Deltaproteobacteria bacterium]|nr:FAD-dependent oxidoreductase [Deltaproteobacteria bacterium]